MLTQAGLLLIGAAMVVAAGFPAIERLVEPARWGPRYPVPDRPDQGNRATVARRGFQPLDLGPDPVSWPSETSRPDTSRPLPDWPSARWDDPHFGKKAREARSEQQRSETRRQATPPPSGTPSRPPREADPRAPLTLEQAALAQTADFLRRALEQVSGTPNPPVAGVHEPALRNLPDLVEIERLVAQHGLAGTVKAVMDRTGLDFRDAARHIAQVRRRGR